MQIMAHRLLRSWPAAASFVIFVFGTFILRAESPSLSLPTQQPDTPLKERLTALTATHHGQVSLYATQLNTGKTVAIDADHPVRPAGEPSAT